MSSTVNIIAVTRGTISKCAQMLPEITKLLAYERLDYCGTMGNTILHMLTFPVNMSVLGQNGLCYGTCGFVMADKYDLFDSSGLYWASSGQP